MSGDAGALSFAMMSDLTQGGNDILTGGNNYAGGTLINGICGDAFQMFDSVKGGDDNLTGGKISVRARSRIPFMAMPPSCPATPKVVMMF